MAIEFKSKIFNVNPLTDEGLKALKEDAEILSVIEAEKCPSIVDSIKEIILAKTEKEELAIQEKMITSRLVPNLQVAVSTRRFTNYFFK